MPRRSFNVKQRPDTVEENVSVLRELDGSRQVDNRSSVDLIKHFAKLNAKTGEKHKGNVKNSKSICHNKSVTECMYGPIPGFPVGSWWGIRMDCSRDRVHDPFIANVHYGPLGAVSICTPHINEYNDVDLGNRLTFTGQACTHEELKDESLILNYQNKVPVRLIRCYSLANEFAPKTGYRYDGLYGVSAYWIGISSDSSKHCKFALTRLSNQDPPPWENSSIQAKHISSFRVSDPVPKTELHRRRQSMHNYVNPGKAQKAVAATYAYSGKQKLNSDSELNISSSSDNARTVLSNAKIVTSDHINMHESAIVTRRVFKKKDCHLECSLDLGSSTTPGNSLLSQCAHRSYDHSFIRGPKLQNTNISIRTDLYDSTHNLQQDSKRMISVPSARIFKPTKISTRILTNFDSESSPFIHKNDGTVKIDTLKISKIIGANIIRSGSEESNKNYHAKAVTSKSESVRPSMTQDTGIEKSKSMCEQKQCKVMLTNCKVLLKNLNTDVLNTKCLTNTDHSYAVPYRSFLRSNKSETANIKAKSVSVPKGTKEGIKKNIIQNKKMSDSSSSHCSNSDEEADVPGSTTEDSITFLKSRGSMDSLTPDKLLNIITTKKYHPMAKLLISSMIGLTTGESRMMSAYDELSSQTEISPSVQKNTTSSENLKEYFKDSIGTLTKDVKDSPKKRSIDSTNTDTNSKKLALNIVSTPGSSRCRMQRTKYKNPDRSYTTTRSSLLKKSEPAVGLKDTDNSTENVNTNNLNRNYFVSIEEENTSGSNRLVPQSNNSSASASAMSTASQPADKVHPTKKSNSSKMARRGRNEIANLAIDAILTPIVRGPRIRRLRPMSRVRTRSRYEKCLQDGPMYPTKRPKLDLSLKQFPAANRSNSTKRKKYPDSTVARTQQSGLIKKTSVSDSRPKEVPHSTRKLPQSRSVGTVDATKISSTNRHKSKENLKRVNKPKLNQTTKIAGSAADKKIDVKAEPPKSKTTDATIQCSLLFDVPMERRISRSRSSLSRVHEDQEPVIKIEVIDLVDVKSETEDDTDDQLQSPEKTVTKKSDTDRFVNSEPKKGSMPHVESRKKQCFNKNEAEERLCINSEKTSAWYEKSIKKSAFVPVNLNSGSLSIARLKSIGFKPIKPCSTSSHKSQDFQSSHRCSSDSPKIASSSAVAKRTVNEEYDKYTSEENNIVGYMDQELRFQDIEEEDKGSSSASSEDLLDDKSKIKSVKGGAKTLCKEGAMDSPEPEESTFERSGSSRDEMEEVRGKDRYGDILSMDDEQETPWHGWKKVITDEQTCWVGW
ncbi:uncharacterized protein LOC105696663 [Orussus abietinus]|uniref:uncharacterized protein LOC105696663 n=1 Tax=Orussus abietinus TaxID=222816 RepID=UPI0006268257|nr:uncharacterized protein LOC105696663 [Orussus abietinus]